jgi:hypothetical protein
MLAGAEVEQHLRVGAGVHSSVAVVGRPVDHPVGNIDHMLAPAIS